MNSQAMMMFVTSSCMVGHAVAVGGSAVAMPSDERHLDAYYGNEARPRLMESFGLSEIQAQAILDMRLQRLTGLERDKITLEQQDLHTFAEELRTILNSDTRLMEVIKEELIEVSNRFADPRRTRLQASVENISILDRIK